MSTYLALSSMIFAFVNLNLGIIIFFIACFVGVIEFLFGE